MFNHRRNNILIKNFFEFGIIQKSYKMLQEFASLIRVYTVAARKRTAETTTSAHA